VAYSAGQIQQTIAERARAAAPAYGIRNIDGFVAAMVALAGAESSWNPLAIGDNGASGGLYQLHERGQGAGMSMEDRQDPYTNIEKAISYLAPVFAAAEAAGYGWQEGLRRMAGPDGQNPADPEQLYRNALTRFREIEQGFNVGMPTPRGTTGQAAGQTVKFAQWLIDHGFGGYVYETEDGTLMIHTNPPASVVNAFLEDTSGGEAGAEPMSQYDIASKEAGTALNWANVESIIAYDQGKTYEQGRQRILDKIDQEHWTAEQAISEFNAWMAATTEAGRRAETAYGEEKERAVWTRPTPTYERPAHRQVMESYGLEYTPEQGIPVSQMPSQEQMYSRFQQNLGIQQQAPPTAGGWQTGQGMGQGTDRARVFLRGMNLPSAAGM